MPCDSLKTVQVSFGPQTNHDRIADALQMMGLNPVRNGQYIRFNQGTYDTKSNTLSLTMSSGQEERTSDIKRAYSASVVKAQAKRFGWQVKETGRFQYEVTKRSI